MLLDQFNLNQIRVFECVYRTRSMTMAAKELHITQSGVSQHIKSLEAILEITLFDRVKQKLLPTSSADQLYSEWSKSIADIEKTLLNVSQGNLKVQGTVKIGSPYEFAFGMLIPILQNFSEQHDGVFYHMELGFASKMIEKLINGEIDFAFLDSVPANKEIKTESIFDEELVLCAHNNYLKKFGIIDNSIEYLSKLDYFRFSPGEPLLRNWFQHHFNVKDINLKIKGEVANVKGIQKFITHQMGVGIIASSQVELLPEEIKKEIHIFEKEKPILNKINLALVNGRTLNYANKLLIEEIKKHFNELTE